MVISMTDHHPRVPLEPHRLRERLARIRPLRIREPPVPGSVAQGALPHRFLHLRAACSTPDASTAPTDPAPCAPRTRGSHRSPAPDVGAPGDLETVLIGPAWSMQIRGDVPDAGAISDLRNHFYFREE